MKEFDKYATKDRIDDLKALKGMIESVIERAESKINEISKYDEELANAKGEYIDESELFTVSENIQWQKEALEELEKTLNEIPLKRFRGDWVGSWTPSRKF